MKMTKGLILIFTLLAAATYGQRNIIGEYSTIHMDSTWGGLDVILKADSTYEMTYFVMQTPNRNQPITKLTGKWRTEDSTRTLILEQKINDSLTLNHTFPFIDHLRIWEINKDDEKTKAIRNDHSPKYYPMVLYKLKGYYPDGTLEADLPRTTGSNVDDCPPTGIWKYYYPDKTVEEELDFTDSKGLVTRKMYYENGNVKSEQQWRDNLKDGEWKQYDETGKLTKTLLYKKDKLKKEY